MRRRGAKSFVDDLSLSRGVVLSRAELFCDLLRLSPSTRRFVRLRRTYLQLYCLFHLTNTIHFYGPIDLFISETLHTFWRTNLYCYYYYYYYYYDCYYSIHIECMQKAYIHAYVRIKKKA